MVDERGEQILAALQDPDLLRVTEAAKALRSDEQPEMVGRLLDLLRNAKAEHTRFMVAWALRLMNGAGIAEALYARLQDSLESINVRAHAAEALSGQIAWWDRNDSRFAEYSNALMQCLDDASVDLRYEGVFASHELLLQPALPKLRALAENDHAAYRNLEIISEAAKEAIEWIESQAGRK